MDVIFNIFLNNILPIFILILLGLLMGRTFKLDLQTLSRLNFYVFVPAFTFTNLYSADLDVKAVMAFAVASVMLVVNLLVAWVAAKPLKLGKSQTKAFQNSIAFYNSGNIGIPLVTLVFSTGKFLENGETPWLTTALATQIMVLVVQNATTNTIGYYNAWSAKVTWKEALVKVVTMPTIYGVLLALLFRNLDFNIEATPVWTALKYISNGLVSIALLTLGVQLSRSKLEIKLRAAYVAVFLRLLGGPLLAFLLIRLVGLGGVTAQALMISSGVPTAVNTALIAADADNHPDYAAQVVLMSTILCSVTLIGTIYTASMLFPV